MPCSALPLLQGRRCPTPPRHPSCSLVGGSTGPQGVWTGTWGGIAQAEGSGRALWHFRGRGKRLPLSGTQCPCGTGWWWAQRTVPAVLPGKVFPAQGLAAGGVWQDPAGSGRVWQAGGQAGSTAHSRRKVVSSASCGSAGLVSPAEQPLALTAKPVCEY